MTNRAAAGSVLAVAICLADVPVSTQQPRNAEAARKAAEAVSSKLPSIAIIGADGLSATIDGRLSYEDGKTMLRYTIANTGDEPLLEADLTLLVYERSGKRRETQTISMDLGGVLEAGARKALKSDLAVRVDFSDRVRLGISRAVTATGPWTSDRFEERSDKGQLPAVDTIDPKPMPVRLESARVVEKQDRLRAEFDFISLADDPVVRATVTLLVYDENGKRTGLQDMPLPGEQLPLPPREKATVNIEIDGQLTIKPGNHVRLGVKSVLAGDAEQDNLRLVTDSDRKIAEEHESHVSVVSPDVAPAAITSVRLTKDWEMRPQRVVLTIENRRDEPLLAARVRMFAHDSKGSECAQVCSFDFTRLIPSRAPVPAGGSMFFGCALKPNEAEKLNKQWLLTISLESAATAGEAWMAATPSAINK